MGSSTLFSDGNFQAIGNDGLVVSYGKLYVYNSGDGSNGVTYTTSDTTVPNAWPIVLSASGKANVFLKPGIYDIILKDQYDVVVWSIDNYDPAIGASADSLSPKFKSFVFTRSNTQPQRPTGGSYANPFPIQAEWTDGIPIGSEIAWMSSRTFTESGIGQDAAWAYPSQLTDTASIDMEYSTVALGGVPSNPTANPENWENYNSANASNYNWMAVRTYSNGVWSSWQVSQIKGEDGSTGVAGAQYYKIDVRSDGYWRFSGASSDTLGNSSASPYEGWRQTAAADIYDDLASYLGITWVRGDSFTAVYYDANNEVYDSKDYAYNGAVWSSVAKKFSGSIIVDGDAWVSGIVQTSAVYAQNLEINSANIQGKLTVGQIEQAGNFYNGAENASEWIVEAGTTAVIETTGMFTGAGCIKINTTDTAPDYASAVTIPEATASFFSGRNIEVSFYAKKDPAAPASQFAAAYSTYSDGDSGWQYFTPTSSWQQFTFQYVVPTSTSGDVDYITFWPSTSGGGNGILVDNIFVIAKAQDGTPGEPGSQFYITETRDDSYWRFSGAPSNALGNDSADPFSQWRHTTFGLPQSIEGFLGMSFNIGDQIRNTWYNSSNVAYDTKDMVYDGSSWSEVSMKVDGSVLIDGSVVADKIAAGEITADKLNVGGTDSSSNTWMIYADTGSIGWMENAEYGIKGVGLIGVAGEATESSYTGIGVQGYAYSPSHGGYGVSGYAGGNGGPVYGGKFFATDDSTSGIGVYGEGKAYGGEFKSSGTNGVACYGRATGLEGLGGSFSSASSHALEATTESNNRYGVWGRTTASYGFAGYFEATGNATGLKATSESTIYPALTGQGQAMGVSGLGQVANGYGGYFECAPSGGKGVYSSGGGYDFYADGPGTNYGPFTGAHDGLIKKTYSPEVGDILQDTALINRKNVSNTIFEMEPATSSGIGVVVNMTEITADTHISSLPSITTDVDGMQMQRIDLAFMDYSLYNHVVVNAVGEGQINVCETGGNISARDCITFSSTTLGKGEKQADNIRRSDTTVAIAREAVDWGTETDYYLINGVKCKMIACIYDCG